MNAEKNKTYRDRIAEKGLKVTPQRLAVLDALIELNNHPTADMVIQFVQKKYSNIAIGTVYKILETFVETSLVKKINTEKDIMQYDATLEPHFHIHISGTNTIEDYCDKKLNNLIVEYLRKNMIPGLDIEEIKLQIIGKYKDSLTT